MAMLADMAKPKRLHLLTGRPSRYTIEAACEILTRMSEGESLHRICKDEHLPAEATVRGWADNGRHPAFMDAFRRAQRHQAHRWFEQTIEIADESKAAETVPEIGSYQLRVRARQWAAARLAPDQFGERVEHRGVDGVHVYQVHVPDNGRLRPPPVIDGHAEPIEDGDLGRGRAVRLMPD
jgi:hypothetical protein